MYNEQKAAQVVARFLLLNSGPLPHVKLGRLVYLAEREFLNEYDTPILFDTLVSMADGPVLYNTNNLLLGLTARGKDEWNLWLRTNIDNQTELARKTISFGDLLELCVAEEEVIDKVWGDFGHMDDFALGAWMRRNCGEWQALPSPPQTISYEALFVALGKAPQLARELEKVVSQQAYIEGHFVRT